MSVPPAVAGGLTVRIDSVPQPEPIPTFNPPLPQWVLTYASPHCDMAEWFPHGTSRLRTLRVTSTVARRSRMRRRLLSIFGETNRCVWLRLIL